MNNQNRLEQAGYEVLDSTKYGAMTGSFVDVFVVRDEDGIQRFARMPSLEISAGETTSSEEGLAKIAEELRILKAGRAVTGVPAIVAEYNGFPGGYVQELAAGKPLLDISKVSRNEENSVWDLVEALHANNIVRVSPRNIGLAHIDDQSDRIAYLENLDGLKLEKPRNKALVTLGIQEDGEFQRKTDSRGFQTALSLKN